jgi:hypothetical protein
MKVEGEMKYLYLSDSNMTLRSESKQAANTGPGSKECDS